MIVISPQIAKRLPPTDSVRDDHAPRGRRDLHVRDGVNGTRFGDDVAHAAFTAGLARPLLGLLRTIARWFRYGRFRVRRP